MSTIVLNIPTKYTKQFSKTFIEKKVLANLDNFLFQIELEEDMKEAKNALESDFHNL